MSEKYYPACVCDPSMGHVWNCSFGPPVLPKPPEPMAAKALKPVCYVHDFGMDAQKCRCPAPEPKREGLRKLVEISEEAGAYEPKATGGVRVVESGERGAVRVRLDRRGPETFLTPAEACELLAQLRRVLEET